MSDDFDPIKELLSCYDTIKAGEILRQIELDHDRQLHFLCSREQYEPVRQALCSLRPDLESRLRASAFVPSGQIMIIDPSALADRPALRW